MDKQIITIQNVRVYLDAQGTAWLNAEDVARGLGFVEAKKFSTSGENYVRWERVNGYLKEFGYKTAVGKDDFIPENMFYRLAMKANNETAQVFQAKVADEILPSIRKTGMYINPDKITSDMVIALGLRMKELETKNALLITKNALLETQVAELQPKASYYDLILNCPDLVSTSTIAKDYGFSGKAFNKILRELKIQFKQGGIWLLYQKYARLGWTSTKTYHFTDISGQEHCRVHTYWTQKGRLGLYELLKQNGYLPTIEQAA